VRFERLAQAVDPHTPYTEAMDSQIGAFVDDLYVVNAEVNLTRVPPELCESRHLIDSALLLPFLPPQALVLDIGCGPGFPAWLLAMLRPDISVVAMDSAHKMLRFMERHPLKNLSIRLQRAEEWVDREAIDVVTGRALAPFAVQAELSAPYVKIGGAFIPFRTPTEREEIAAFPAARVGLASPEWHEVAVPGEEAVRLFPVLRKEKATPQTYPRSWAMIKKTPLGGLPGKGSARVGCEEG
jgi:16S rRNA (guanine527-N7)-methyltransferase